MTTNGYNSPRGLHRCSAHVQSADLDSNPVNFADSIKVCIAGILVLIVTLAGSSCFSEFTSLADVADSDQAGVAKNKKAATVMLVIDMSTGLTVFNN